LWQVKTSQRESIGVVKIILIHGVDWDLPSLFERGLIDLVLTFPQPTTTAFDGVNHLAGVWDNYRLR
jgi:hypothetical protein